MLVLSRKQQQEILIGDEVKITVLKIKGNTVRLGIEAPREVKVIRGELPRKTELPVQQVSNEDEAIANVTVVFSDPVERTGRTRSELEVLKFEQSDGETCSISFRQSTPDILKHNRLRQIVDDISKTK